MPNDIQEFILHFLNGPPFNLNLSPLQFDQIPSNQLLQHLSDILSWIFQIEIVDIRREAAEESAVRILNLLRILRYRPPVDNDELEEWRAGIVEGSKSSLYPLLVFLFENAEALKERAYLAKFLMKTEVPGEVHDYDTAELQAEIEDNMKEFKEIHAELKEIQADVILLDDIKEDLKSMEKEKQLLYRKIDKAEKKVQNVPYFERHMQVASLLRGERDRIAEYTLQKHQERQKLVSAESRINRLKSFLNELRSAADTLDQTSLMEKMEDEVATNTYLASEKLAEDVRIRENKLKELATMVQSSDIRESDISKLQAKVEESTKRIKLLEEEMDQQEEEVDENMSIFRHQVTALERKKESAVQKLQNMRQDLSKLEKDVEQRKKQLQEQLGGEVLSTVQYKKYLEVFRSRNEEHKKKKKEMSDMQLEKTVLKRTSDILSRRYDVLKSHIEDIGGEIVEVLHVPQKMERPKTAAPSTNDVEELKVDMTTMMLQLDEKKDRITEMRAKRDEMSTSTKNEAEQLDQKKFEKEELELQLKRNNEMVLQSVKENEQKMERYSEQIPELKKELATLLDDKNVLQQYSGTDDDFTELEGRLKKAEEKETQLNEQIAEMGSLEATRVQAELWKSLLTIFEIKMECFKERLN